MTKQIIQRVMVPATVIAVALLLSAPSPSFAKPRGGQGSKQARGHGGGHGGGHAGAAHGGRQSSSLRGGHGGRPSGGQVGSPQQSGRVAGGPSGGPSGARSRPPSDRHGSGLHGGATDFGSRAGHYRPGHPNPGHPTPGYHRSDNHSSNFHNNTGRRVIGRPIPPRSPYIGIYVSPFGSGLVGGYGYGYWPYYAPRPYLGSYTTGYRPVQGTIGVPLIVGQGSPSLSQQVITGDTIDSATTAATTPDGTSFQRQAEAAFRAGDFALAARLANHALIEMPRNGKLLLFFAQTLFAVGDYGGAAAVIHQATAELDSSEWGYVVENYKQFYRGRAFVEQMDRLNAYLKEHPDASYAYFLRGYEQGFLGHLTAAQRDLSRALELESRDELAAQLMQRFGGTPPAASDQTATKPDAAIEPIPSSTPLDVQAAPEIAPPSLNEPR